jgi:hypothetical protein
MASTQFSLNAFDWKKVATGAGIAVAGALLTYVTQVVASLEPGPWTPVIVAVWSVVVNIVKKWIAGPIAPPTAEEFNGHTD